MNLQLALRDCFFDQGGNVLFKLKSCFLLKLLIKALLEAPVYFVFLFPAKSSGC